MNVDDAEALADLRDTVTWASLSTYSHSEVARLLAMAVTMLAKHQPAGAGGGQ